jgi:hypothetical protein
MDAPPSLSPALTLARTFHHPHGWQGASTKLIFGLVHCGLMGGRCDSPRSSMVSLAHRPFHCGRLVGALGAVRDGESLISLFPYGCGERGLAAWLQFTWAQVKHWRWWE